MPLHPRRLTSLVAVTLCAVSLPSVTVAAPFLGGAPNASAATAPGSCFDYGYSCTPGYDGANAAGTWAWRYYGAGEALTANGYHNCTLYAAFRLAETGMPSPGHSWGAATQWAASIGGGNHDPAPGSIAWYASGHVAYVEQVSGNEVYIRADNWPGKASARGWTDSKWVTNSSVSLFLHPHDVGATTTPPGTTGLPSGEAAFQANNGYLYTYSSASGAANLQQGMMAGTSPSIAALAGGGYEEAFQANTGNLIVFGDGGDLNTQQGMMAGTSPSIAASPTGGFEVAFQANNGYLYTYNSSSGAANLLQGMMAGTSPSIAALAGGGYEEAFQANTGVLIVFGNGGDANTQNGMMAGTSPGIAASPNGGFEAAFQANNGYLYTYSSTSGGANLQQGMMRGTGPGIAALAGGGYEEAFQANTGNLVVFGDGGDLNTQQGMMNGTSPSIAGTSGSGYEVAFQANNGYLYRWSSLSGAANLQQGMMAGTSPAMAP